MSEEKRELLEKLKFELAFVEDGGCGRSVRAHPCGECVLSTFPRPARTKISRATIFRSIRRAELSPVLASRRNQQA